MVYQPFPPLAFLGAAPQFVLCLVGCGGMRTGEGGEHNGTSPGWGCSWMWH